jgi:hypothetical protein
MTISELINCDIEKLEAMSFAECEAHFAPYFSVTRPSKPLPTVTPKTVAKGRVLASEAAKQAKLSELSEEKQALLRKMGLMK